MDLYGGFTGSEALVATCVVTLWLHIDPVPKDGFVTSVFSEAVDSARNEYDNSCCGNPDAATFLSDEKEPVVECDPKVGKGDVFIMEEYAALEAVGGVRPLEGFAPWPLA